MKKLRVACMSPDCLCVVVLVRIFLALSNVAACMSNLSKALSLGLVGRKGERCISLRAEQHPGFVSGSPKAAKNEKTHPRHLSFL